MKTQQRSFLFLILLGAASLLLPACGGGSNVKSQKAPETVLGSDPSATPSEDASDSSSDSYVSSIGSKKSSSGTASTEAPAAEAAAQPPTSSETPAMETAAPVKKGSSWLWWVLLALVLVGAAYLAWKKRQAEGASQPMPPVGGLSPVSGFTAVKDRIEETPSEGTSFWSKKLF